VPVNSHRRFAWQADLKCATRPF